MKINTRELTEMAISVALTVVCSFICVYRMPQGGSIALTMIPVLLIAYRRGPAAGIITGTVYGLVSLLLAAQIYHPLSILLDFVLAFAVLGIAGFFGSDSKGIIIGSTAATAVRFLCSFISGATVFASYAPEGQNVFLYSLIYNATYMVPELIISIAVLLLLRAKVPVLFEAK